MEHPPSVESQRCLAGPPISHRRAACQKHPEKPLRRLRGLGNQIGTGRRATRHPELEQQRRAQTVPLLGGNRAQLREPHRKHQQRPERQQLYLPHFSR